MNIWFGTGENARLSNLSLRTFKDKNGVLYQSVEHAYQTWKSGEWDSVYHRRWRHGSKFIGKKKANREKNIEIMYKIMKLSFIQNPKDLEALLATGSEVLTHNQDKGIWKVKFPELLMRIRTELREEQ